MTPPLAVIEKPKPIRLLLADDEEGFVRVLERRLARRNVEATCVTSGAEALRSLRHTDFDVAILDLKMGDMDGIELLKIFKTMAPELPVIILTGHGSEQSAREGMAAGAHDYLMKPCDLDALVEKLRQIVGRRL